MKKQFDVYIPDWKAHDTQYGYMIVKGLFWSEDLVWLLTQLQPEPKIINLRKLKPKTI